MTGCLRMMNHPRHRKMMTVMELNSFRPMNRKMIAKEPNSCFLRKMMTVKANCMSFYLLMIVKE